MNMQEYREAVVAYCAERPEQRVGQAHFNVLWNMDQHLANRVRSTERDPFYTDVRLPEFLAWLAAELADRERISP